MFTRAELYGDVLSIGCTVNYNHWGAPKRWYGVPSAAAHAFEGVFRTALPEQFERHPDLLFHLTAMLSPRTLLDHQVPVFCGPAGKEPLLAFQQLLLRTALL